MFPILIRAQPQRSQRILLPKYVRIWQTTLIDEVDIDNEEYILSIIHIMQVKGYKKYSTSLVKLFLPQGGK